ncbi:ABC transporter family protein [Streptomyces sp. HB202]|nr:ABC transporter family protein [Streptomyces sp. HB202]
MFNNSATTPPGGERQSERVRFDDLNAGYPGRPVLHQLSGVIPALAMTALVGPNGSGKSTLLGVLAGVIDATSGQLRYAEDCPPAFVPQRGAVGDTLPLTARQTVEMGRWGERGLWRKLTRKDRTVVDSALERLGVADLAGRQLGELSGGQRQRVLIAQGPGPAVRPAAPGRADDRTRPRGPDPDHGPAGGPGRRRHDRRPGDTRSGGRPLGPRLPAPGRRTADRPGQARGGAHADGPVPRLAAGVRAGASEGGTGMPVPPFLATSCAR